MTTFENGVLQFWRDRSAQLCSDYTLMYLEPDARVASEKFQFEKRSLMSLIDFDPQEVLVDLGAGVGLWTSELAHRVGTVFAVEREETFVAKMKGRLSSAGIINVDIINEDACVYCPPPLSRVDSVYISGLAVYLTDTQMDCIVGNAARYLAKGGRLIHRESCSTGDSFSVCNKYVAQVGSEYNAIYRNRQDYDAIFVGHGFRKILDQNAFPEGSPYNKWDTVRKKYTVYSKD